MSTQNLLVFGVIEYFSSVILVNWDCSQGSPITKISLKIDYVSESG